ncbi:hypothetical protein BT69DRAFT_1286631 [Atractiella rhizophila]|nr:hypothetical protein BT69DRAFT_1289076 [Atractiella rhizophila]KAH8917455.1 hypothetical protein BT69DRAFT_1286631 [Atractiella rhizophila]
MSYQHHQDNYATPQYYSSHQVDYSYPPPSPGGSYHNAPPPPSPGYHNSPGYYGEEKSSTLTMADEYASAREKGFEPDLPPPRFHPNRGSVAAFAAAEGTIPKKEGLRMWRQEEHQGEFMKGGRKRMIGRCCCCTIVVIVILLVGIVAGFLLWVRPPNVQFNGIEPPSNGSEVQVVNSGFMLNFNLNIGVVNPNFFGASFEKITAQAYYPGFDDVALGGGSLNDVTIPSHSNNTIHFPFSINYTSSLDPSLQILQDLIKKCGFTGQKATDLEVDYKLTLKIKVVLFSISPSFHSSAKFPCPLDESDLEQAGLGSLFGGSSSGSSRAMRRWGSLPLPLEDL